MKRYLALHLILALGAIPSCLAQDHSSQQHNAAIDPEREDQITEELKTIRLQLDRIEKQLAAAVPGEESVKVDVSASYAIGRKDAPVTLVEFADYQCPFCRQFHTKTLEKLRRTYIDTGKVRFVALDLPLDIHADAFKAAEAALCAGEQFKFWDMQHVLITNSNKLDKDAILGYAGELRLDKTLFRSCLESDRYAAKVKADAARADDLDITSTPTFVLGRTQSKEIEGVKLVGVQSYSHLRTLIEALLEQPAHDASDMPVRGGR